MKCDMCGDETHTYAKYCSDCMGVKSGLWGPSKKQIEYARNKVVTTKTFK